MWWVLKITIPMRRLFWAPKTYRYVGPSQLFSVMLGQFFLGLISTRLMCLAQGHNGVPPVRLEPTAHQSQVKLFYAQKVSLSGPEVIELFSCSTQLSTKFILLINVKMPTIVGILTFMSDKIQHLRGLKQETSLFVGILVFMSGWNFVLSWVEHEKSFITSGPGHVWYEVAHKFGLIVMRCLPGLNLYYICKQRI